MVLLDTSVLAYLLYPDAPAPIDPATGHAVGGCNERLQHFVKCHQKSKILIAAPTYAEFLVKAGPDKFQEVDEIIKKSSVFKLAAFDEACALECALLEQEARVEGDKKRGGTAAWQKVKFDRQILSVGLFHSVTTIYTDDENLKNLAVRSGIEALGIADMPLPEAARQHKIDFSTASQADDLAAH
ncbi:Uncharacterised protein [Paucimonas lemoignei]|nr:Uncharacterised protein [Paucimonas lemoignei]